MYNPIIYTYMTRWNLYIYAYKSLIMYKYNPIKGPNLYIGYRKTHDDETN